MTKGGVMARKVKTNRKTVKISREMLEQIGQLSPMNNAFMNLALEGNIVCVEEILRVILGKPELIVSTARTQSMLQGFRRSIYLDVYAEDSKGTARVLCDIYNKKDVLKRGKTVYTIYKYIDGDLDPVDDGSHKIYINGSAEDDGTGI